MRDKIFVDVDLEKRSNLAGIVWRLRPFAPKAGYRFRHVNCEPIR